MDTLLHRQLVLLTGSFPIIQISSRLHVFMGACSILRINMRTSVFLVDLVRMNGDNS